MTNFYSYGIDHLNIGVTDGKKSRDFYVAALEPLGIALSLPIPPDGAELGGDQAATKGWMFGFMSKENPYKPFFWLLGNAKAGTGVHIAFAAATRAQVDAFFAAAIGGGAVTTARLVCAAIMMPIMGHLCATPMATASKRSATRRRIEKGRGRQTPPFDLPIHPNTGVCWIKRAVFYDDSIPQVAVDAHFEFRPNLGQIGADVAHADLLAEGHGIAA